MVILAVDARGDNRIESLKGVVVFVPTRADGHVGGWEGGYDTNHFQEFPEKRHYLGNLTEMAREVADKKYISNMVREANGK